MRIHCKDLRLGPLVERLRAALGEIHELDGQTLEIEVMSSAADNKDGNPAGFRTSTGRVEVYDPAFFALDFDTQLGVLAHELGEYAVPLGLQVLAPVNTLKRDFQADYFACLLGFSEELLAGRRDRGPIFEAAIRAWRDPASFSAGVLRWKLMHTAGLA